MSDSKTSKTKDCKNNPCIFNTLKDKVFTQDKQSNQKLLFALIGGILFVATLTIITYPVIKNVFKKSPPNNQSRSTNEGDEDTPENPYDPSLCGGGSKLQLSTQDQSLEVNKPFTATISLDTRGCEVDAVDTIIQFDPGEFEITDIKTTEDFSTYPLKKIDNKQGEIKISGLADINKPISGSLKLAELTIIPLESQEIELNFEFEKGSTVDSNIIEHKTAQDLLVEAQSLKINPN